MPFDNVAGWPADPAWGAAAIVIPHAVWKQTGDAAGAAAAYPTMRAYAEFLVAHASASDGLVRFGMLGDWNPLNDDGSPGTRALGTRVRVPVEQVSAFYGALCLGMLAEVAAELHHAADAARYAGLAAAMKVAYHEAFYRPGAGSYAADGEVCGQTANVLPAGCGAGGGAAQGVAGAEPLSLLRGQRVAGAGRRHSRYGTFSRRWWSWARRTWQRRSRPGMCSLPSAGWS